MLDLIMIKGRIHSTLPRLMTKPPDWLVEYANMEQALTHGAANGRWSTAEAMGAMLDMQKTVGGIPNANGVLYVQTAAVRCPNCAPNGPPLPIGMTDYMRCIADSDEPWRCPLCGGEAEWDSQCPETRPAAVHATDPLED